MNGNGKIKFPRHCVLRRRRPTYSPVPTCNRTTFSATTVGPSDQYQLQKGIFQLRLWSDSQLRFHPRRPTTVGRKLLRGDAGRRTQIQIAGFSLPLLRSQSEHGRKLAQSCSGTKISPGNPPSLPRRRSQIQNRLLPACSPPLFRPQSDHGPTLAQSYSRNNTNTMRADT